jgi:hypothetical protein
LALIGPITVHDLWEDGMSDWCEPIKFSLAANEVQQIVQGGALVIVKNGGPGTLLVGQPSVALKKDRVTISRQNDLTLHAGSSGCTVMVYYAGL